MQKKNKKEIGAVVKIDSSLLKKVEQFVNQDENKFRFVNKKQFIDLAVHEFLNKMEVTPQAYPEKSSMKIFTGGKNE